MPFFLYFNLTQRLFWKVVLWTCYVFAKVSRLCLHRVRNMTQVFLLSVRKSPGLLCFVLPGRSSLFLRFISPSEPTPSLISLIPAPASSSNPLHQLHPWASDFSVWPVTCQSLHFYMWKNENKNNISLTIHSIKWKKTTCSLIWQSSQEEWLCENIWSASWVWFLFSFFFLQKRICLEIIQDPFFFLMQCQNGKK